MGSKSSHEKRKDSEEWVDVQDEDGVSEELHTDDNDRRRSTQSLGGVENQCVSGAHGSDKGMHI